MAKENKSGYLELFLGPMFSGKTSRLIEIYKTQEFCGQNPLVINFSGDNRYPNHDTHMSSHDSRMIPCIKCNTLSEIFDINQINNNLYDDNDDINKNNVIRSLIDETHPKFTRTILINEGQFFPDILPWVKSMISKLNKRIYIAALDGDFERNTIGDVLQLIPYSNKCSKLTSLCYECRDGTEALFSYRITNETTQIVIGTDNYIPLCRSCYDNKQLYSSNKSYLSESSNA